MTVSQNRRPNILFVVIDCARADHCSVYGYPRVTTPGLERLAKDGHVFEQAISPAGWSLPAHASLFTGLYPSEHGTHDENQFLDPSVPVLAEEFARAGYRTMSFCENPWVSRATGLDRGFAHVDDLRLTSTGAHRQFNRVARKLRSVTDPHTMLPGRVATQRASAAISELARGNQPFFMFVHYNEVHTPRRLPERTASSFLGPRYTWTDAAPLTRDVNGFIAGAVKWGDREIDVFTALYDAALAFVDSAIDQLINTLRAERILDHTLIIITADHGENLGEHQLMGHKLCLYDTLLRVPLILRFPGVFDGGKRTANQVQTIDIAPAIYHMAGLPDPRQSTPNSQRSPLTERVVPTFAVSEQFRPNLAVFTERYPEFDPKPHDRRLRSIRTDEWKYIWSSDGRHELFSLRNDAPEEHNVASIYPDVVADLDRQLTDWVLQFQRAPVRSGEVEFDEIVTSRLRALGYIP
ncbi:MAG: sulfatase [Nitrolancea sp.]